MPENPAHQKHAGFSGMFLMSDFPTHCKGAATACPRSLKAETETNIDAVRPEIRSTPVERRLPRAGNCGIVRLRRRNLRTIQRAIDEVAGTSHVADVDD